MTSTSPSDKPAPHIINKLTEHPLSAVLLGEVVGAHWMGSKFILYYADGHKALFQVDDDGDILVGDYEMKEC